MRSTLRSRAPWLAVALMLAFVACESDAPPRFYRESFEMLCEGVPCGWSRTSGNADQATWIETIHPGEHGLRLIGDVSVRGPAVMGEEPIALGAAFVRVTARCDTGSMLRVDVVLADTVGSQITGSALFTPPEDWSSPFDAALSADVPLSGTATRVIAIGIAKTGTGACEISEIAIDDQIIPSGC